MNVSELARKLNIKSDEMLEVLPAYGFDIGKRAIKVDDKVATQIIRTWGRISKELEYKKRIAEIEKLRLEKEARKALKQEVHIGSTITVKDFATTMGIPVVEIIKRLMGNGIMATLNQKIDFDTASIIADDLGVTLVRQGDEENNDVDLLADKLKEHMLETEVLVKRPPVIVIMGHVDHGKTKLLDTIRSANVMGGEAGGITQHIGAYQVIHNGKTITFIDTPGHEAFTAMRSRGARVADIAILVVAADDSIQPQTKEAINIIGQANIPMIVAINKIDKPDVNIEKVKQDLAQLGLIPEDWGGKTMIQPISAKSNINIDKLLDLILLVDEMEAGKIQANPNLPGVGSIIESHVDKGEGPVATVLVQSGHLEVGDSILINGQFFGKARALRDYTNKPIDKAMPSQPVKIIGLKYAANVGDLTEVASGEIDRSARKAKDYSFKKEDNIVKVSAPAGEEEKNVPVLPIIVKADTLGSLEVILESLAKLSTAQVRVKVISSGLGNISDGDVIRAETDKARLLAFHVKPLPSATRLATEKKIEIKQYKVIYKLLDEVKLELTGLIKPEMVKTVIGKIEILQIFKTDKKSMVLGGKIISGKVVKGAKADVIRDGILYETGQISELRSGKFEVNEVSEGTQCGMKYNGSADVVVGDIFEIFTEQIVEGKL